MGRYDETTASGDHQHIVRLSGLLRFSSQEQEDLYLAYLEQVAGDFVDHPAHWRVIEALADRLVGNGRLSGRELRQAIRETM